MLTRKGIGQELVAKDRGFTVRYTKQLHRPLGSFAQGLFAVRKGKQAKREIEALHARSMIVGHQRRRDTRLL